MQSGHQIIRAAARRAFGGALGLALITLPALLQAQNATIIGWPVNFDTVNSTGQETHGFEIEADGIQPSDVTRVFGGAQPSCVIRYCTGSIIQFAGGVYIRWASPYDPSTGQFTQGTPIPNGTLISGESCWTGGLGNAYAAAGCEHFGISTAKSPTNVVYRWLVADPNNPGQLAYYSATPGNPSAPPIPVPIPQPLINVVPPAQAGAQPVVNFQIQIPGAPQPPRQVPQWGDAKWVKVFEQELPNEVDVNDLVGGNPNVPENEANAETPWKLLQTNPNSPNSGVLHSGRPLSAGSHAVVRRYEFYNYTGALDPSTHEALCAGAGDCASPQPGELGDFIGAQMAAVNLEIPSVTVTKIGSGTVTSPAAKINCGGVCTGQVAAGTQVTLTSNTPGDAEFGGWTGDCVSASSTCTFTVNKAANVTATFTQVFNLSVGRGGNGSIAGTPNGAFSTFINCGSSCSAKFPIGTAVTLTATPLAGHVFVNWTGACSGTAPTCTVNITKDTTAQANFK
jgi:uncharacterized repeat protein (TIGR02543 family)